MIKIKVHNAAYPFTVVGLVEDYKSLIWTERYYDVGEFELQVRMTIENYELLALDRGLSIPDTTKRMIIESHEIKESEEDGDATLILRGRSLECILDRRIVLETMYVYGKLDPVLNQIMDDNIISTAYGPRDIPNFTYQTATGTYIDNKIFSSETVSLWGEEILSIVVDYCQRRDVGFELELDSSNDFVFHLYNGISRTIYQTDNPPLMFSKAFDNLKATSFYETKKFYKTDTLVVGQIATEAGKFPPEWLVLEVEDDYIPGLEKRETMTDASDLNRYTPSEDLIPLTTYSGKYMQERGKRDLLNNKKVYQYFEATVDLNGLVYRTDYALGDLISYRDSFGNVGTALIEELIISDDSTGKHVYPILATRPSDHYSHIEPVVELLIVGGGGAGGAVRAGGGGAGEVRLTVVALEHNTEYDIVVGAGGTGNAGASGSDGGWSQFGDQFADGGGGGGYGSNSGPAADGHPGYDACGGGGGGSVSSTDGAGGSGKHYGGGGSNGPTNYGGGGGGGDSQDGYNGVSAGGAVCGDGGAGTAYTITGSSVYYGGGGGGYGSTNIGDGGLGGGGTANPSGAGYAGAANTGGGGGAGSTIGGAGGSGLVVLKILTSLYSGTYTGSPTITTVGDYKVLKFTGNGSYTS